MINKSIEIGGRQLTIEESFDWIGIKRRKKEAASFFEENEMRLTQIPSKIPNIHQIAQMKLRGVPIATLIQKHAELLAYDEFNQDYDKTPPGINTSIHIRMYSQRLVLRYKTRLLTDYNLHVDDELRDRILKEYHDFEKIYCAFGHKIGESNISFINLCYGRTSTEREINKQELEPILNEYIRIYYTETLEDRRRLGYVTPPSSPRTSPPGAPIKLGAARAGAGAGDEDDSPMDGLGEGYIRVKVIKF